MSRLARVLLVALVALGVAAPSAAAVPHKQLGSTLGAMWKKVLETPAPQNPFTGGDPCVDLGGVVAPFAPPGTSSITCTVKPGTKVFVAAFSSECSTVEEAPYFGRNEAELRVCARAVDAGITRIQVTVDGKPVTLTEVESGLLKFVLPKNNVFEKPPGTKGLSVAHGWVALLHPLTPGTHKIMLHIEGTYLDKPVDPPNITTTIIVKPGHR